VNANSVIQVYKFHSIFKKIGQTKALYFSYVFPRIFTLMLSYLNDEREKQTHLCGTNGLSDYSHTCLYDLPINRLHHTFLTPVQRHLR